MQCSVSMNLPPGEEERRTPPECETPDAPFKTAHARPPADTAADRGLVFRSEAMQDIVRAVERLADKDRAPVLVMGESGTGKTALCKLIHELSPRKARPFVEIGCSSIPDSLIESELFGYEKGAFTDAKTAKKGLVEMADGGTLFLDEIGDMPLPLQSKLLSLIEQRSFRKIGGLRQLSADVRIIAATNRNLVELVREGRFRLDLYYRLNVVTLEIPPLCSRAADIPALIDHYLHCYGTKYGCGAFGLTQDALDAMLRYPWPGNVRELKNLMERLVIMSRFQPIDVGDLPGYMILSARTNPRKDAPEQARKLTEGCSAGLSLKVLEETSIRAALKTTRGNQRKAAKLLDITRDTLRYRMKKLGIAPEKTEGAP